MSLPSLPLPAPGSTSVRIASPRRFTAALLGNPNTGKTTLFNALSGLNQRVGNYPGVTVETKKGQTNCASVPFDLIDLPGTYSLAPRSPDEMLAVDVILGRQAGEPRPDVVISIVDASNLERNLYLTTQALELGVPVVVALNMIDVSEKHGLTIDVGRLSAGLGVPVVPIQANRKRGLDALRAAIARAAEGSPPPLHCTYPEAFEKEVASLRPMVGHEVPDFLLRRLLLDVAGYTESAMASHKPDAQARETTSAPSPARRACEVGGGNGHPLDLREELHKARQRLANSGCPVASVEARCRYAWIRQAIAGCIQRPAQRPVTWTDRLDRILTHRLWGTLFFMLVMFLVFQAIYTGARPLMKAIDAGKDWLGGFVADILPPGPFTSLLVEGVIGGVGAVVVFLPQILILFAFIAVLEDCGYMARAAFVMDRLMSRCGLSGKSFIPLLSSVACAVPGIMATRVIEDRRDRLATILVAPLMSCSARLPVYILLIGAFLTEGYPFWTPGVVMFAMYALGLILAPLVALALKRTLLAGQTPVFVLEMPAYKRPSLRIVVRRLVDSGWMFLRRAGTIILASMILVWVLLNFPAGTYPQQIAAAKDDEAKVNELQAEWKRQSVLGRMGKAIEPAVRPLGWDWRVGVAVLASFPAREVVVSTLGTIYQKGKVDSEEIHEAGISKVGTTELSEALRDARWEDDSERRVFTVPAALSLMVFFALCCQCASTLAVIRRETRSWRWPAFTFAYMTALAYLAALIVFQVGTLLA
jgi:ferrous iron transport protein B